MKRVFFSLCAGAISCALLPALAIAQSKETAVLRFNHTDGANPTAGLIDVNGTLYGTTAWGPNCPKVGTAGCGTVFSIDPTTRAETVLYAFCSQQNCTDGQTPQASLIDVNGTLYGTTQWGGAVNCANAGYLGCGTIFSIDPTTGAETFVHSFGKGKDGTQPLAGLIDVNGTLYGTTSGGGANCQGSGGCGTVFALDPKTGAETVLYSFCAQQNCSDGSEPFAGIIDVKGTLYGTTMFGGADGGGTVFGFNVKTGAETVLHSFSGGTDGSAPDASLIDVNGTLYSTTTTGGSNANRQYCAGGCGTVFSLDIGTGVEAVLYAFCNHPINHECRDGDFPVAGLIDVKGILYGTTPLGGTYYLNGTEGGVLFALDPNTGAETVLHAFGGSKDGRNPEANLLDVTGTLYGTTIGGGDHDYGTVFKLRP
ncbi:MAG TPA: choice-of-anchor tandem repeat GloVer-containing protein [Rhizomicrobium sp.]|jgi:uncharacterized repeat protein (TIGR03803 family)|nr:choice-of-anchor tandem repeat GloVer-containing protein [Rhizomicrobium sp.]